MRESCVFDLDLEIELECHTDFIYDLTYIITKLLHRYHKKQHMLMTLGYIDKNNDKNIYENIIKDCDKRGGGYEKIKKTTTLFCEAFLRREVIFKKGYIKGKIDDITNVTAVDFCEREIINEEDAAKYIILNFVDYGPTIIRIIWSELGYTDDDDFDVNSCINIAQNFLIKYDFFHILFKLIIDAERIVNENISEQNVRIVSNNDLYLDTKIYTCEDEKLIAKLLYVRRKILCTFHEVETKEMGGRLKTKYKEEPEDHLQYDVDVYQGHYRYNKYLNIVEYSKDVGGYDNIMKDIISFCKNRLGKIGRKIIDGGNVSTTHRDHMKGGYISFDELIERIEMGSFDAGKYILCHFVNFPIKKQFCDISHPYFNIIGHKQAAHLYLMHNNYIHIIFKLFMDAPKMMF